MFFSIIIPLYNRPQEIGELLHSLLSQTYSGFEVIIVEDGSTVEAKEIVEGYRSRLDVHYYRKENEGQGFARNYGFARARGDFFIVFDSDIIVPTDYLEKVIVGLERDRWDAFGGPDAAHESFSPIQKAISYSMTSPFTTGGIRGNKRHVGQFNPRSFNMGISREIWEKTGGFKLARRSEDIEFSLRMIDNGFKVGLIPEAFVYHKRRTSFAQFYRQTNFFGKGRVDIYKLFPNELKPVHALPAIFVIGLVCLMLLNAFNYIVSGQITLIYLLTSMGNTMISMYFILLLLHACWSTRSLQVGLLSVVAAFTQLIAYGSGFIEQYIQEIIIEKK
ncbi:glycosyltransferase [Sphingobacterium sp. SYP-B4668]|uniref:glycosyltransferase n=1 Tax=Sphingobacterium sp. SYP-B4668 TaxID=2996035 RepID=UPI0022DDC975|nr:glycosyltransferase [Sphingobacterium sp. SYP-B4668]